METEHSVEHYQRRFAGRSAHIWVVETAIAGSAIGYLVALDLDDAELSNQMEIKRFICCIVSTIMGSANS
jgi:hypothetical protein